MSGPGLKVSLNDPRLPALRRVRPPGLLVVCAALLDIVFCTVIGVTLMMGVHLFPVPQGADPNVHVETWKLVATYLSVLITRGLALWGAWSSFSLRRWHLALVGALLIMTPLAPSCCLGLIVGIWMVFTLLDPDVRKFFT